MVAEVHVKATSNGGLKRFNKSIQEANLSKTAADIYVSCLKQAIDQRVSGHGTDTLKNSVKAVKRSNQEYGVNAAYYFWYANYGRPPGKPPGRSEYRIDAWAADAGITGNQLRGYIKNYGTQPKYFYEVSKILFEKKRKRIWKNIGK